jgi:hypothetical protein
MDRVPGHAWLLVLAAVIVVAVASAAPFASAPVGGAQVTGAGIAPNPTNLDPHTLAGAGALVVTGVLLLLFFYRRRLYILFWVLGWAVLAASMFVAARQY